MSSRAATTKAGRTRLYLDPEIRRLLRGIAHRLCPDQAVMDDLVQEGLVWLWLIEDQNPGQTRSWYLQSSLFHLRKHLAAGRSLDSHKREKWRVSSSDTNYQSLLEQWEHETAVRPEAAAGDLIAVLEQRLTQAEKQTLQFLAEGLGPREIARHLGVSHQAIVKRRRRIAMLASRHGLLDAPDLQSIKVAA